MVTVRPQNTKMGTASSFTPSSLLLTKAVTFHHHSNQLSLFKHSPRLTTASNKTLSFTVRAAKLPPGVELPKVQPKFEAPFLGFTRTAEIWNSRACMIGLIGTFIVELIINKGILQVIGVEVGKGLDIPL